MVTFACFMFTCSAWSQDNFPQFRPPSPDAYGLGKYGEVPVSYYTGVPDISIPLCELVQNDLSAEVSLSYHGSGIKVDEIASWVGLGWSLNAGGIITRVVHGRAEHLLSNGTLSPTRSDIAIYNASQYSSISDYIDDNNFEASATNQYDNEPDEYFYNFGGRTGSFYFDANGNVMLNKQEGLDIKAIYVNDSYGNTFKFIIKTENGNIYEFSSYERTFYPNDDGMIISAWYLTKITSPSGDEINFEYQQFPSESYEIRSYTEDAVDTRTPYIDPAPNYVTTSANTSEIKIKKISTRNGYVQFSSGTTSRLDCPSATYPLEKISVYRSDGTLLKYFRLFTSYFEANNNEKYAGTDASAHHDLNYRLRLDSIQAISGDNTISQPPYKFMYLGDNNPATEDVYTLPCRLSSAIDHWGYYNHATSNQSILPGNSDNQTLNVDQWYMEIAPDWDGSMPNVTLHDGANRSPDAEAMKAGSLSEVYYPTGGYTKYTFEPNVINYQNEIGAGLRIKDISNYDANNNIIAETRYQYANGSITFNPKYYYYKKYAIEHYVDGTPAFPPDLYAKFGLPYDNGPNGMLTYYVKISAAPQAVLGSDSQIGYGSVTVAQTGNGYITYVYDNANQYPDYLESSDIDATDMSSLSNLFYSEDVTDFDTPGYPPGGFVIGKALSSFEWPNPPTYSNAWKRGVLTQKSVYSESSVLLSATSYEYSRQLLNAIAGYRVVKLNDNPEYIFAKYYVPHALLQKSKEIYTQYDMNGANPVTTTTNYYYDNSAHLQPTRVVADNSKGELITTHYRYPLDYTVGSSPSNNVAQGIKKLQDDHVLNAIVEQYTQRSTSSGSNLRTVSAALTTYKTGSPEPDIAYGWVSASPSTSFSPATITASSFTKNASYIPGHYFDSYDSYGSILQQHKSNDVYHSYIWDYSGSYPVAEAVNASQSDIAYTSFEADGKGNWTFSGTPTTASGGITGKKAYLLSGGALSRSGLTSSKKYTVSYWVKSGGSVTVSGGSQSGSLTGKTINGWTYHEVTVTGTTSISLSGSGYIDEVRLYPTDASVSSYTYDPLVGMTSQCDEKNNISYYEYDSFGRLKLIRDEDGKILKQYDYQYQAANNQ